MRVVHTHEAPDVAGGRLIQKDDTTKKQSAIGRVWLCLLIVTAPEVCKPFTV